MLRTRQNTHTHSLSLPHAPSNQWQSLGELDTPREKVRYLAVSQNAAPVYTLGTTVIRKGNLIGLFLLFSNLNSFRALHCFYIFLAWVLIYKFLLPIRFIHDCIILSTWQHPVRYSVIIFGRNLKVSGRNLEEQGIIHLFLQFDICIYFHHCSYLSITFSK